MENYLVTGFTGQNVTASLDAHMHAALVGAGSYVTAVGNRLAASIVDTNTIRLADGALFLQGLFACIPTGQYADVSITSGSQGQNRLDLIGFQYTKNVATGQETGTFVAIKGTPVTGTPQAPAYTAGDCLSGDVSAFLPLYLVRLTGLTLESVSQHPDWQQLKTLYADETTLSALTASVADLRARLTSAVTTLRAEMTSADATLRAEMTSADEELRADCASLRLQPGKTTTVTKMHCAGMLSGAAKTISFSIPLSRPLQSNTTVTLSNPSQATMRVRHAGGGYLCMDTAVSSVGEITCGGNRNCINISITAATAFSAANNTPVAVEITNFAFTFT